MKLNEETAHYTNNTKQTIPVDLVALPQWVAWTKNKEPINPKTGNFAKTSDPTTWGTYEEAITCCRMKGLEGVGFVFSERDPFVGIDLDDSLSSKGEPLPWAKEIVDQFRSYTEISPSGRGLHIIARGHLSSGGKKRGDREIYDRGRFFTVTGSRLAGAPATIETRETEVEKFYNGMGTTHEKPGSALRLGDLEENDRNLIQKALNAENGEKFGCLWSGNYHDYPSQSEADLALCTMLSYWANGDPNRIDRLFRHSGLMRPKWDHSHYGDGSTYGQATIKKSINTSRNTPKYEVSRHESERSFKLTDLGNAERLVWRFSGDILYCHEWNKWLVWDGNRWTVDRRDCMNQKAKEVVRSIYGEAVRVSDSSLREQIARHAMSSESSAKIRSMLFLAESEVPVTPEELDRNPWLLSCQNGTIDLRRGEFFPARREDRVTKLAPVEFNPEARCPKWDAFLERTMDGNKDLIEFLQRAIGYSLTGDTSEQCLFILFGSGANGKSTFLQTISAMLGDYAKQTPTETLLVKRGGSIPNDIARLKGARFVTASEAEADHRLAESLIKQMTGSDTISARFLHQEYFDFESTHKVFLGTNHKPVIKGTDYAIWRRIKLIPFGVTIPEEERDRRLLSKLKEELPGILAWAVRGCKKWTENGLGEPDEVRDATQGYKAEMDVLAEFLSECCVEDPVCKVASKDIYQTYLRWCETNGETPVTQRSFGVQLREKGFTTARLGKLASRGWTGLKLLTQPSPPTLYDTNLQVS